MPQGIRLLFLGVVIGENKARSGVNTGGHMNRSHNDWSHSAMVELSVANIVFRGCTPAPASPPLEVPPLAKLGLSSVNT